MEEVQTKSSLGHFDLQALNLAPLVREPFEFVIAPKFAPAKTVEWISRNWPDLGRSGAVPIESVPLNQMMRTVIESFESDEFRDAIATKLGVELAGKRRVIRLYDRCRGPGPIHLEPPPNVAKVLFYPNISSQSDSDNDSCMRFTRTPDSLNDFVAEILPVAGTLAAFCCRPNAWHGRAAHFGRRNMLEIRWQDC
ncbi:MAG: hypothetical protein HY059_23700 [Proteobacteria bacterium]|nr:hypothetical protein [Pseudomonadota bacterium]